MSGLSDRRPEAARDALLQRLQVSSTEASVRLEVATQGPLVPRLDEHEPRAVMSRRHDARNRARDLRFEDGRPAFLLGRSRRLMTGNR